MKRWDVAISSPVSDANKLEHELPGAGGVVGATALDSDADHPTRATVVIVVEAASAEDARARAIQRYVEVGGVDGRVEAVSSA